MNQPTREEHEELKKRVEQLEQEYAALKGQTEPIKITRLEIDPRGMQEMLVQANKQLERIIQTQTDRSEKFDTIERGLQALKQELNTHSNNWLETLQKDYDEYIARFEQIETTMVTKDEMKETKADITNIRATQSDHGEMLKTMATKDDIKTMATKDDIAELKDLILKFLPKSPES